VRVNSGETTLAILVSGDAPQLGLEEAASLTAVRPTILDERILLLNVPTSSLREALDHLYRAVLCKEVILAKSWQRTSPAKVTEALEEAATSAPLEEMAGRSFAVKVRKIGIRGRLPASDELAARVGRILLERFEGRARVDLSNPEIVVRVLISSSALLLGILLLKPRGDRFQVRAPPVKPFSHPATLTPEQARLLVNLANPRGRLLDPFCGTGSILIEASTEGLYSVGVEVDGEMALKAWRNLKFFNLEAYADVIIGDARKMPFRPASFDSVATDPPYGHLAPLHGSSIEELYAALLNHSRILARSRVVFIRPEGRISSSFVRLMTAEAGFRAREHHIYVHDDLTRVICIAEA